MRDPHVFFRRIGADGLIGFDETYRRMWTFHFAQSEAGFRSGHLEVQQLLLAKEETAPGAA